MCSQFAAFNLDLTCFALKCLFYLYFGVKSTEGVLYQIFETSLIYFCAICTLSAHEHTVESRKSQWDSGISRFFILGIRFVSLGLCIDVRIGQ